MKRIPIVVLCMLILFCAAPGTVCALGEVSESLLVNLDLSLDASAVAPANVQVRIHATDNIGDAYFASPVDPDEGDTVDWQQQLPLTIDANVPMRLIFHIADTSGAPLPSGYAVQWQFNLDGSTSSGSSVTIPAGSSDDMNLTVRGTVVAQ